MGEIISLILAFCSGKAKKISGGTIDNVVTCDANGNPKDSGYSINDIITSGNHPFRADEQARHQRVLRSARRHLALAR